MSNAVYETAAQIGAFVHETPDELVRPIAGVVSDLASGLILPDTAAYRMDKLTADTALQFSRWRDAHEGIADIAVRETLQDDFKPLEPAVNRVLSPWSVLKPGGRKRLGSGSFADSYVIDGGESGPALLKVQNRRTPYQRFAAVEWRLPALIAGRGGFEQPLAITYKKGLPVTTPLPGKSVRRLSLAEVRGITDEQLASAVFTVGELSTRHIVLDWHGDNTNYDAEQGFGFYDPESVEFESTTQQIFDDNMTGFMGLLVEAGRDNLTNGRRLTTALGDIAQRLVRIDPHIKPHLKAAFSLSKFRPPKVAL